MQSTGGQGRMQRDRWYVLFVLTLVYTLNIADRFVVSTLIEPIKREFALSDTQVGLLTGAALALFYVAAGIPLGTLADRVSRKRMIAVSLLAWSVLTAASGMTRSFGQLLVARIFVGIGEAGGTPPSVALLSDKFPPRSRGWAMSLYAIGAAAGAALGASLGGWISDTHGWRAVLVVFGAVGMPVALLVALTLREPRRGILDEEETGAPPAGLGDCIAFIRRHAPLMHVIAGATVLTFWGWGLVWWTPSFLLRSFGMSLGQSGAHLGLMHAIGGTAVTLATAVGMRLTARGPGSQARFVAWATFLPTIPSFLAFYTNSPTLSIVALWLFVPMVYLYIGPTLALAQNMVPATMRSQTGAIILFTANVANLALAPLLVGALSDMLAPHLARPADSLRWVLVAVSLTGFWAGWHFLRAARLLERRESAQPA